MAAETGTYISDFQPSNPNPAVDPVSEGGDHLQIIKLWIQNTFPNIDGAVLPTVAEMNYLVGVTSDIQTQIDNISGGGPGNSVLGDFTINNGDLLVIQDSSSAGSLDVYNTVSGGVTFGATAGGSLEIRSLNSSGGAGSYIMRENGVNLDIHNPSNGLNTMSVGPFGIVLNNGTGVSSEGDITAQSNVLVDGKVVFNRPVATRNFIQHTTVVGGVQGLRINGEGSNLDFPSDGNLWFSGGFFNIPGGIVTWGGDIDFSGGGAIRGDINNVQNVNYYGSLNNLSDESVKENIKDLDIGLETINGIRTVRFDYIDGEKDNVGVVAQEIQEVFPEAVSEVDGKLFVDYVKIVPVLVRAVQELSARVAELEGS